MSPRRKAKTDAPETDVSETAVPDTDVAETERLDGCP